MGPTLVLALALAGGGGSAPLACTVTLEGGARLEHLALADTAELRTEGLAGRADIGGGALFLWQGAPEPQALSAAETLVALDIAWIDERWRLFGLEHRKAGALRPSLSMRPARALLEVPRGTFRRLGIAGGERIDTITCTDGDPR